MDLYFMEIKKKTIERLNKGGRDAFDVSVKPVIEEQ